MLIDPEGYELAAVTARLPRVPRCHVVEIGCGDGRLTRRYSSQVASVLAIDSDSSLIAAFRDAGIDPNVETRTVAASALRLADQSADAVLFSWAL